MSLSDPEVRQLHELFEVLVEQTLTDEQSEQLARRLRDSAEARQLYVRYLALSASLRHYAGLMQSGPVEPPAVAPSASQRKWAALIRSRAVWALSACLLVALGVGFWLRGRPASAADPPVVEVMVGDAEIETNGATQRIGGPTPLAPGDRVRVPANALALLRYADASCVELRPESVVLVGGPAEDQRVKVLQLEQGTLFAEVQPQRTQGPMVILTPNARARVLGTRFLLTATLDETRLDVQRGKVQFAPLKDHQSVDVVGGHVAVATGTRASPSLQITRAAPASQNLVQNPGFEGDFKNGKPEDWGGQRLATLDRTVAHAGTTSLKITGPSAFSYVWQSIALEPDTSYRLSVWIKTDQVSGKDGVRARYAQIQPVTIVWRSPPIRGTSDWVQWQTEFRTPPNYCCGRLDLTWELNEGETAWFDDVELVQIDAIPPKR